MAKNKRILNNYTGNQNKILTKLLPPLNGSFFMSNLFAHPGSDALTHALFEGGAEGAVAVVATLLGQLLGDDGFMFSGKLAVAGYEVTDAKVMDVCIVVCALTGEILAEIVVVHADGCRELRQVQVLLHIELRVLAVLLQQFADMGQSISRATLRLFLFYGYWGDIINLQFEKLMTEVQVKTYGMFYASQEEAIIRNTIGDSLYNLIHEKTGVEPGLSHHYYEIMRADTSSVATVEYYKQLAIQYHECFEHINDK